MDPRVLEDRAQDLVLYLVQGEGLAADPAEADTPGLGEKSADVLDRIDRFGPDARGTGPASPPPVSDLGNPPARRERNLTESRHRSRRRRMMQLPSRVNQQRGSKIFILFSRIKQPN